MNDNDLINNDTNIEQNNSNFDDLFEQKIEPVQEMDNNIDNLYNED